MTVFPDLVRTVLSESIIGRAQKAGYIEVRAHNIRDYSTDRHRNTDDTPYGGGDGMVMTCQPIYDCYRHLVDTAPPDERRRVIYLSPKGRVFHHDIAKELAAYDRLIFLCGHYEGVDQRVLDEIVDEEISLGDFVVTGGEIPACIVIDAVARLIDGVLPRSTCYEGESIASGILEYPQYTKPRTFRGREVPPVLLSGDHAAVDRWRLEEAVRITREKRPDLLAAHPEIEESLRPKPKRPRRTHKTEPAPKTVASSGAETDPKAETDSKAEPEPKTDAEGENSPVNT